MAKHIPYLFLTKYELENKLLNDENFHHLVKVLRLKEQSNFFAMDNQGNKFNCIIDEINKNTADYNIIESSSIKKSDLTINLIQAITKIETFEEILDKATQLGVNTVFPLITKNVNTSLDLFNKKNDRFNKILKSSAEQSQRAFLPFLAKVINIENFKDNFSTQQTLIAYEKSTIPMKESLKRYKENTINIVCGPEGGFTEEEMELLSGYPLISIGKNILRAETASIVLLGNTLYELDA